MTSIPILLIGCGRMGRGIARMLLIEQRAQPFNVDLWIFDPNQAAEEKCQREVQLNRLHGIHSLREAFSKSELLHLIEILDQASKNPQIISQALSRLYQPIKQIQPRLILNAATYFAQQLYIPLARQLKSDYIDLGQKLPNIQELQQLDNAIRKNNERVRIIQECGLAPGLANILAASMYEKAKNKTPTRKIYSVQMRVGGLPQHSAKNGNLHYGPTFSTAGLIYEYEGLAYGLENGRLISTTTFTNPQYWENSDKIPVPYGTQPFPIFTPSMQEILLTRVDPLHLLKQESKLLLSNLQARPTADGTSRMCFDSKYQSGVLNLEYKTLRFSPHYQTWAELEHAGTLAQILKQWDAHLNDPLISGYPDLVLLRVWAQATPKTSPFTIEIVTLHDDIPFDSSKGFTAMQHLTGWPTVLLALNLIANPPESNSSYESPIFRPMNEQTAFKRSIQSVLQQGGIIAPYELLDGIELLKLLNRQDRISLCQVRCSPEQECL